MQYKITATGVTFPASHLPEHFPNVSRPAVLAQSDLNALGLKIVPDPEPLPLTPEEIEQQAIDQALAMQAAILQGMTALFDATAQARNYDNCVTCALRAGYPGPFHDEGVAFATWMDTQNAKAYTLLAQVKAGAIPMPESVDAALALLDPMVWPA